MKPVRAVAEAMASQDGKLDAFLACETDAAREDREGFFGGYIADAESLIERVEARGCVVLNQNSAVALLFSVAGVAAFIGGFSGGFIR